MQISRDWATPLTIGAFILMACTGILMFFHWDTGMNKDLHEWLGWALVAGVALHGAANWSALKRHLARAPALAIIGVFVALLAASFFITPEEEGSPVRLVMSTMLQSPLKNLAPLAGQTPEALVAKLQQAGFKASSPDQTLTEIAGPEREQQNKALATVLPAAKAH
jgi:Na+/melibiose symporter-like transporter